MRLDRVTFTGIDEKTDLDQLFAMQTFHDLMKTPYELEFGVLLSLSKQGKAKANRYPMIKWIDNLMTENLHRRKNGKTSLKIAVHLCGHIARSILTDGNDFGWTMNRLAINSADRIQWNLNSAKPSGKFHQWMKINGFKKHRPFILQNNPHLHPDTVKSFEIFPDGERHVLHDASGGRGIMPQAWPGLWPGWYNGFAGGIGPENIIQSIKDISAISDEDFPFWIDMEGRIRSDDDWFDIQKVRSVIMQMDQFFKEKSRA